MLKGFPRVVATEPGKPPVVAVKGGLFTGQFGVTPPQPEYTQSVLQGATAQIELPNAVDAGSTLRYVIDLANPTANDMVLDPCPSYQQALGEGGKDPLEFNCLAVPLLPAGQTRRFAMELDVPLNFPTGPAEVYWNLAAFTDPDISARRSVDVIGADTPCRSDQLAAAITGPGTVPGLPNLMGVKGYATAVPLTLTNRSTATCSVRGTPTVDLRTGDGTNLGLPQADEQAMHITGPRMPSPTVVLGAGGAATTTLYWYSDFCGSDPNPLAVTVTLPTNGAMVEATPTSGWRPPPCPDGPPGHGEVGADPFQPG